MKKTFHLLYLNVITEKHIVPVQLPLSVDSRFGELLDIAIDKKIALEYNVRQIEDNEWIGEGIRVVLQQKKQILLSEYVVLNKFLNI